MKKTKMVLYGHFGSGNVGNDSSLEAALYKIRSLLPSADITCVCDGPEFVAERFKIATLPIDISEVNESIHSTSRLFSLIRRVFSRVVDELIFWIQRPAWFRSVSLFIVVGTGAVDDMAIRWPWNAPYDLYKWCKCAKLGGAKVVFLSVGVGPILNPVSRFLMLKALRLADYRSYRETGAMSYLHSVRFDTTGDSIYPDLVFSLDNKRTSKSSNISSTSVKTVALGVINYYGWKHDPDRGESIYQEYLSKIRLFVSWLLDNGYSIRVITGDNTDKRPLGDIMNYVRSELVADYQDRIIADEISNVDDLFEQLAQTEIVVASRFHNVLCALMRERPVISLGYHEKNEALMTEMGLARYCDHIEHFTYDNLIRRFNSCVCEAGQITSQIHGNLEKYRDLLDEQYENLLSEFREI